MPEWPEMENYRTKLAERIAGQTIIGAEVEREKSLNVPAQQFIEEVTGKEIWFVERRGKHIIFHLNNGKRLLLHLMLGGWMYFGTEDTKPDRTAQVTLRFPGGNLYFIGLRLGYLHLLSVKETEARMSQLGPEPMEKRFTLEKFQERFKGKRGVLKSALLDQQVIAGIGNYYSDEIAFAAAVRPDIKIPALTDSDWSNLYTAMHQELTDGVRYGGYMENPFTKDDNHTGGINERCKVYDREGEHCVRCNGIIVKTEIASRKSFYCPDCQKGN
ncbi:Fpg/Nei family DNA glycosylase [Paenibacillaceae bacterium]|nr:Fpg/Nei family DNA glycosylase [Paenibacillaceae bacterium]